MAHKKKYKGACPIPSKSRRSYPKKNPLRKSIWEKKEPKHPASIVQKKFNHNLPVEVIKKLVLMPGFSLAENVIRNRLHPFIKELAPYCSKITIVSPGSSHHKLKISNPKIKYITVKNEKKSSNFMWRFIQEIQISRKIWKAAKAENPDVLIASIPSMALLFQAQKLAKLQVLDIRDLTW